MGTANIAKRSLIPTFFSSDRFEVKAIASRSISKAEDIAKYYPGCKAYAGYSDICQDPEIDLIYCPLPTGLHYEHIVEALENDKHVMSEKSLGQNYDEVKKMVQLAKDKNLLLIENFQFRFHSQHKWVKDIIANGDIGDVRCFRSSFGFPPFPDGDINIRYNKSLGGGALLDAGAYTLKAMQFILPEYKFKLKAASLTRPEKQEVEIFGGAFLASEEGITAELAFGFDNYYQCNYEIWGSKGKITVTRAFTAREDYKPTIVLEKQGDLQNIVLPADNHFAGMVNHVAYCLDNEEYEDEYAQNLSQSSYITAIKNYVYGK